MKYIYALTDPRDKRVRYIGQSSDPNRRYQEHIASTGDGAKSIWVQELRSVNRLPVIVILGNCNDDEVSYLENWWILLGRRQGWELTNATRPGEWRVSDDFKALFSDELHAMHQEYQLGLQTMYEQHQIECKKLSEETVRLSRQSDLLAIERASVATEAKAQARVKKVVDITHFAVYGFVALFITFGVVQLVLNTLSYGNDSSVFVRWLITILWSVQYYMIYMHYTIRKLDPSVSGRLGYHVMFGAMAICDIFGGTFALIEIGRMTV